MKSYVQNLAMLSAVIAFGCNSNKSEPQPGPSQSQTATAEGASDANTENTKLTIEGVVQSMSRGKDGYTAVIQTKDNNLYYATISRANLRDPKQYRDFNDNEIVKLTGDSWKMGQDNQLTVREIN